MFQELSNSAINEGHWYLICFSLAVAVRDLHTNGYIHNQIWPDNIQISEIGGRRVGVLENFLKACGVETAKVFTKKQVQELELVRRNVAPELLKRVPPSSRT